MINHWKAGMGNKCYKNSEKGEDFKLEHWLGSEI